MLIAQHSNPAGEAGIVELNEPIPAEIIESLSPGSKLDEVDVQPTQNSDMGESDMNQPIHYSDLALDIGEVEVHIGQPTDTQPQEQSLGTPLSSNLPRVFPQYMCGAIKKTIKSGNSVAAITINFAPTQAMALLSMEILPEKLPFIAAQFFFSHLEPQAGFQHIIMDNGTVLQIPRGAEIVLLRARTDFVNLLLGSIIEDAMQQSHLRMVEVQEGLTYTECARLLLRGDSSECGQLSLQCELERAFVIAHLLF